MHVQLSSGKNKRPDSLGSCLSNPEQLTVIPWTLFQWEAQLWLSESGISTRFQFIFYWGRWFYSQQECGVEKSVKFGFAVVITAAAIFLFRIVPGCLHLSPSPPRRKRMKVPLAGEAKEVGCSLCYLITQPCPLQTLPPPLCWEPLLGKLAIVHQIWDQVGKLYTRRKRERIW